MKNHSEVRLYNMVMPLWMIAAFMPQLWLILLPLNWLIDFLVLWLTMKAMRFEHPAKLAGRHVWLTWIFGFAADLLGGILMIAPDWGSNIKKESVFYGITRVLYNPFYDVWAFLWTTLGVVVTAVLIFIYNRYIVLRKADMTDVQKRKIALSLAIFTAPYLFYLPAM
jgi:hypothetical protein